MKICVATILLSVFMFLTGCSSVPMTDVKFRTKPDSSGALVTFVRDSIWMGDGINVYLWDGETFIGTLAAGSMVQYDAVPGAHVFMARTEGWAYMKANLMVGKNYFIKANMFPGFATMRSVMKPVEVTDPRIHTWSQRWKAKEIRDQKTKKMYASKMKVEAAAALKAFQDGTVTFDDIGDKQAF